MRSLVRNAALGWLLLLACSVAATPAKSGDAIAQYKAAMTRIFLWKYYAFPIFRENPLFPGYVIAISNEVPFLTECYSNQINGNYKKIDEFNEGTAVDVGVGTAIKGDIFARSIAEIQASGSLKVSRTSVITVAPLSIDPVEGGTQALHDWDHSKSGCAVIGRLLFHDRKLWNEFGYRGAISSKDQNCQDLRY